MACVEKVNYAVIINGIPSSFFPASRSLRQGCPLSPLLFILAMNTLSLHINKAIKEYRCHPLKICRSISISRNLFVDDIIMFGILCRLTCRKKEISSLKIIQYFFTEEQGGWGLLDLRNFGRVLLCQNLWRGIFEHDPWSNIVRKKYMGMKDLSFSLRKERIGSSIGSPIWLSLRKIGIFFLKNLTWQFQSGKKILIGRDQFMSSAEVIDVLDPLLFFLHRKGLFYWDNLITGWQGSIPLWKEVESLGLPVDIAIQWNHIRTRLRNCGIFRSAEQDCLMWRNAKGMSSIHVKDVYQDLIGLKQSQLRPSFPHIFWKSSCPTKMVLFTWLSFHNRNLSWENIRKRGWQGPGVFPICSSAKENNFHLFLNCKKSQQLWKSLEDCYGI
eukprot:PITA_22450